MHLTAHTRLQVLAASLRACQGLETPPDGSQIPWSDLAKRMGELAKASPKASKRLATFGKVIGAKVDDARRMDKVIDGEWIELLSQVLDAVVSPETKRERLNCASCDPRDFPVLLAVIQAVAWGAPAQVWQPRLDDTVEFVVGNLGENLPYGGKSKRPQRDEPPASHYAIAEKTWYRPQLAMLVTSLWPKPLGLEYYGSTLEHILHPENAACGPYPEALDGMVGSPIVGESR